MGCPTVGSASPWGPIQSVDVLKVGELIFASTSSHGGYWLSPRLMELLPPVARDTFAGGAWFEEDCDAAIPMGFLPISESGIDPEQRERAQRIVAEGSFYDEPIRSEMQRCCGDYE